MKQFTPSVAGNYSTFAYSYIAPVRGQSQLMQMSPSPGSILWGFKLPTALSQPQPFSSNQILTQAPIILPSVVDPLPFPKMDNLTHKINHQPSITTNSPIYPQSFPFPNLSHSLNPLLLLISPVPNPSMDPSSSAPLSVCPSLHLPPSPTPPQIFFFRGNMGPFQVNSMN